jgi:hypothetical protein
MSKRMHSLHQVVVVAAVEERGVRAAHAPMPRAHDQALREVLHVLKPYSAVSLFMLWSIQVKWAELHCKPRIWDCTDRFQKVVYMCAGGGWGKTAPSAGPPDARVDRYISANSCVCTLTNAKLCDHLQLHTCIVASANVVVSNELGRAVTIDRL